MKVPYSWLKDFVDISVTPELLAEKLVSAGFEIEEIIYPSDNYKNIVVGEILSVSRHPQADKLLVCKVDVGARSVQIVTNASNVSVGDYVPVCLDGGSINGKAIAKGELRGVLSEGMFCGGSDFGLSESDYGNAQEGGILILDKAYPKGTNINVVLGTDDCVLDVAVTANRPDCNSILGIAREVAAVLDMPLKQFDFDALPRGKGNVADYVTVSVLDSELCPRYMAKALTNIKIAPSPELIKKRLRLIGLRPINNIVDITNYVLIEVGQPMHAFDKAFLKGGKIIVRRAQEGENIVTLDGKSNTLNSSNLVICDAERPVALAGIMGGINSGICNSTDTIILESARFKRDNVRKSSKALGIRSDSSTRFEKGIDFVSQEMAINRAVQLITGMGCGEVVGGVIDVVEGDLTERTIMVSAKKIHAILGIIIPTATMAELLNRLQLATSVDGDTLTINVPQYREDIVNANDIAEEVIRLYGYDNIVSVNLDGLRQTRGGMSGMYVKINTIKQLLSGESGFCEAVTYSFISPQFAGMLSLDDNDKRTKTINLLNPLGEEISVMRTTLLHSMLSIVSSNVARGNREGKLFQVAKVYFPKSLPLTDIADEYEMLILSEFGGESNFYSIKGAVERIACKLNINLTYVVSKEPFLHPGRSADIFVDGERVGYLGEIHPETAAKYGLEQRICAAEINLDLLVKHAKEFLPFVAMPKYPSIERDLAFVLDKDISAATLLDVIKGAAGEYFERIKLFDVYQGKGIPENKKSIAVNISFRAAERTLVDEEVVASIEKILLAAKTSLNAVLRS